jgi:hypothetical protein
MVKIVEMGEKSKTKQGEKMTDEEAGAKAQMIFDRHNGFKEAVSINCLAHDINYIASDEESFRKICLALGELQREDCRRRGVPENVVICEDWYGGYHTRRME